VADEHNRTFQYLVMRSNGSKLTIACGLPPISGRRRRAQTDICADAGLGAMAAQVARLRRNSELD